MNAITATRRDQIFNPLSDHLDAVTRPILEKVEAAIDQVSDVPLFEHFGFGGTEWEDVALQKLRPSSNEACCSIEVNWVREYSTLDLRKPIPRQVAAWLRKIAAAMLKSATAVEAIEDGRDLKQIRAMVKGTIPVVVNPEIEAA